MNVVCAPCGIVNAYFPKQGMRDLRAAGFTEMLLDLRFWKTPFVWKRKKGEKPRPEMAPFLAAADGLSMPVAWAPELLDGPKPKKAANAPELLRERLEPLVLQSIEEAAAHGCRKLIVRPVTLGMGREEARAWNHAHFLRLAEAAAKAGVTILLAPAMRYHSGHLLRGPLFDGQEMRAAVDALNAAVGGTYFGCCLDMQASGGCGQDVYEFITAVGKRLQAVVLTDTDGDGQKQLLPYTLVQGGQQQTDWLSLIRGLRAIDYDGLLVLALRDTAAGCPPLLRPTLLQLAKKTGDYLAWQIGMEHEIAKYEKRVLFGAGRMCRNYLLNYGTAYPPLFTCDNNPKLWGTDVDGLPVKSPEALRDLPKDCAIFICNIYYREIEAQLRTMGLRNPVAYFNDECPQRVVLEKIEKEE